MAKTFYNIFRHLNHNLLYRLPRLNRGQEDVAMFLRTSLIRFLIIVVQFFTIGTGQPLPHESGAVISGYVLDKATGEGLPGANVYFSKTDFGMATNIDGYFVLSEIPPGRYELNITYLGYQSIVEPINLSSGENIKRNFELQIQTLQMEEVVVSGERLERRMNLQTSRVRLNVRQMKNVPQLGEADLFRTLQGLPGVLTETEFSTGLVIRGGNTDQNLILLDGITVYNPSHLGGLFSNFILDGIKEADLIKGGFNVEYGGRLSAVLNVRSREGNQNEFNGKASISLISAQTTLEGPVGKGAWLFSARRTYFDKVFKGTDLYFPYYFYDFQGHIFQDITENDRLSFSWYAGKDDLSWDEFLLTGSWGNKTFSLNYRKLINEKLVSHWMLAKSRFDILFGLGGSSGINEADYIDDTTFKSDWTFFKSKDVQYRFGLELKDLSFVYFATYLDTTIFETRVSPLEGAIYLKMKQWISPRFMIEPGLRLGYYEMHPKKWYWDPRLGMKYLLTLDRYLNFSVGVYHQFMGTVQDDFNPKIMDAWFAVDPSLKPASAIQYVVGYEEYFSQSYRFQLEGYYKPMKNMMTFVERRSTVDETISDESLSDLVDLGDGYAYGLEFFLQKETGRLNGWVAYSYSVARKILHGNEYYTNWDRRHAFNIICNFRLNKKWDTNLKWTYQTGQPYTPILGYFIERMPGETKFYYRMIPGGRNSIRYPTFHRLDIGAIRHYTILGKRVDLFIQIVNTYWRKNVVRYFYHFGDTHNGIDDDHDGKVDEPDEGIPQKIPLKGFPIIPTIGITVDF